MHNQCLKNLVCTHTQQVLPSGGCRWMGMSSLPQSENIVIFEQFFSLISLNGFYTLTVNVGYTR